MAALALRRWTRVAAGRARCSTWHAGARAGMATWSDDGDAGGSGAQQQQQQQRAAPVSSRRRREGVRLYRHYKPIREDPAHKEFGALMDVLEHDYWCDKERENMPGGWPIPFNPSAEEVDMAVTMNDEQVQAGQGDVMLEDPWVNGYLTEDEIMFTEGYKPAPYMPDAVKQQMYYLYVNEGWDIKRLATRFGVRSERVAVILNMKRTEPDMKATGRYAERVDELFSKMYGQHFDAHVEAGENNDQGINLAMLKDSQLPDDVLPKWNVPPKAPKLHYSLPPVPVPPRSERTFKAKYVFKDINVKSADAAHLRVVDYDGTVRPSTRHEAASRTWRMQRWNIQPDAAEDPLDFNPLTSAGVTAPTPQPAIDADADADARPDAPAA